MAWIKRNLYFVIGSAVALGLLVAAGWFNYKMWSLDGEKEGALQQLRADFSTLQGMNPSPDSQNTDEARAQRADLTNFLAKASTRFAQIPSIPSAAKLASEPFSPALLKTIEQLQKDAASASVVISQSNYAFSFQAERNLSKYASASLEPLSSALGEVKAICDVIYAAKVNSLDAIVRARICAEDSSLTAAQADYFDRTAMTNEFAVVTPYEITFHCFSRELASVLTGFGASQYGFVVAGLNVQPAMGGDASLAMTGTPNYYPPGNSGQRTRNSYTPPVQPMAAPGMPEPAMLASGTPSPTGRPMTVLSEHELVAVILLEVVKPLPPK